MELIKKLLLYNICQQIRYIKVKTMNSDEMAIQMCLRKTLRSEDRRTNISKLASAALWIIHVIML